MEENYDGVITVSVLSSLLNLTHNKFCIKSSVNSLPGDRQWWLQCYPAGNADDRKKELILAFCVTGCPVSITTKTTIKKTEILCTKNLNVESDSEHPIILSVSHNELKKLNPSDNFEIEVNVTIKWKSDRLLPSDPTTLPAQIVLSKADFESAKWGDCFSTPKYDVPSIPGLQWWLDYYPNDMLNSKRLFFANTSNRPKVVQVNHKKLDLEDTFNDDIIFTFSCFPSFTLPEKAVPLPPDGPSVDVEHVNGSFNSLLSDSVITATPSPSLSGTVPQPSGSIAVPSLGVSTNNATGEKSQIPVTDSTSIVLNKQIDLDLRNFGKTLVTPKRRIEEIPDLKWGLRIYPAGLSKKTGEKLVAFVCISKPINFNAAYSFLGTDIIRQRQLAFPSMDVIRANFIISYKNLTAAKVFELEKITLCCTVTFNPPHFLTTPDPTVFPNVALKSELRKTVKANRKHFTNYTHFTKSAKLKLENGIVWFVTCFPGAKDDEGKGCINIYLNASTNVSGEVKYDVARTHVRGSITVQNSALFLVKRIYHSDLDEFPKIKKFKIMISTTLSVNSQVTTPAGFSDSSQLQPSCIASSDDEEDSECAGMTDGELLEFRLQQQTDETDLVMQLLKEQLSCLA